MRKIKKLIMLLLLAGCLYTAGWNHVEQDYNISLYMVEDEPVQIPTYDVGN